MQGEGCALIRRSSASANEGLAEEGAKLPALICKQLLIGKEHPDNPINTGQSVYNKSETINDAD